LTGASWWANEANFEQASARSFSHDRRSAYDAATMNGLAVLTGAVLALTPFEINTADPRPQTTPVISCDQATCSVFWKVEDAANASSLINLRWLSADGGLTAVSSGPQLAPNGSAVWNGRTYFVVDPGGTAGDSRVYLLTARKSGEPWSALETSILGPAANATRRIGFAATDRVGLMAWNHTGPAPGFAKVRLRRLGSDGGYLDAMPLAPVQGGNHVNIGGVVEHDGLFYVLFFEFEGGVQWDPYLTIWSETGPVAEHLELASTRDDEVCGTLVVSGEHLLTTWQRNSDIEISRFSFDGGRLSVPRVLPAASAPALSLHGASLLFGALHDLSDGGNRVEIDVLEDNETGFTLTSVFEQDGVSDFALAAQNVGVSWAAMTTLNDAGVSRVQVVRIDLNALGGSAADGGVNDGGAVDGGSLDGGTAAGGSLDGGANGVRTLAVGCGCNTVGFDVIALLTGLIFARPKRRHRGEGRSR
jgi:hypothetical protein